MEEHRTFTYCLCHRQFITFYNHVLGFYMQLYNCDIVSALSVRKTFIHSGIQDESERLFGFLPNIDHHNNHLFHTKNIISVSVLNTIAACPVSQFSVFVLIFPWRCCCWEMVQLLLSRLPLAEQNNKTNNLNFACVSIPTEYTVLTQLCAHQSNVWLKEVNMLFIKQFCVWCYNKIGVEIVLDAY